MPQRGASTPVGTSPQDVDDDVDDVDVLTPASTSKAAGSSSDPGQPVSPRSATQEPTSQGRSEDIGYLRLPTPELVERAARDEVVTGDGIHRVEVTSITRLQPRLESGDDVEG